MKVELVAFTAGEHGTEFEGKSIDEIIVGMARVSSSREVNELFTEPEKLLRHCLLEQHWSVFATTNLTFKIETTRAIGRELLRHDLRPQEFCISGDSDIFFEKPSGQIFKKKIKDLYNLSVSENTEIPVTNFSKKRILNCFVKTFDLTTKTFTKSKISDIFYTGKKHLYEITLENGKKIKTTLEHKFLNEKYTFEDIKNICNVKIDKNNKVTSFVPSYIASNGQELYKNKEQLLKLKNESIENKQGLKYIAEKCNVSYHTIRKWLKIHDISFSKKEVSLYVDPWNKNKTGYKVKPRTSEQRKKMSEKTPKGRFHHSFKGGGRTERDLIQTYILSKKHLIYEKHGKRCNKCGVEDNLHMHHIEEVTRNPFRAYDIENILPLCKKCHHNVHLELSKIPYTKVYNLDTFDWSSVRPEEWRENPFSFFSKNKNKNPKNKSAKMTVYFSKVISIEYVGEEDSYDLEIENNNHNYVANGIVVHNSQRYSEVISIEEIELREQSKNNRQSSTVTLNNDELNNKVSQHIQKTQELYKELLENGVARECARFILPEAATTIMYFNGTIRVWLSVLNQRLHKTAQKEVMLLAELIRDEIIKKIPIISKMMFNFEDAYDCHIFERLVLEKYGVYDMIKQNNFKKVKIK